jgi:hypothetical protein
MSSNFLSIHLRLSFFLLVFLNNSQNSVILSLIYPIMSLSPVYSARNLGVIFDSNLTFSQHISAVSKSCFYQISWPHTHSKYHWSNCSLYYCYLSHLFQTWLLKFSSTESAFYSNYKRLQLVLNAAARAVTKTPKFHHISPILKSLHWLKINERIQYKVLFLTYKTLHSGHPSYLHSLLNLKRNCSTRSSSLVILIVILIILVWKSQIGLFIILLLLCGTVFLLTYVIFHLTLLLLNLILIHLYFPFLLLSFSKN